MPDTTLLLSQLHVKINGQPANEQMMNNLIEGTIESSLHLPDVATLILRDPNSTWVDDADFAPGKTLTVDSKVGQTEHKLFDGEIVELESDFTPGDRRFVIRAFDRLHRLARMRKVRSFVNSSDADIVSQLAQDVGLSAQCGPASTVHPYVLQDNTTNLDFARERAALLGYLLWVEGSTLHFDVHGKASSTLTLTFGADLNEFHPRLTTVDQINSASASGWDPKTVQEVIGKASSANGAPQVGDGKSGGAVAQSAFGFESEVLVADRAIREQSVADKLAQATLDRRAGRFIEAEGTTHGNPELVAGVKVDLKDLGTRFSGKYFVTGATHVWGAAVGYVTRFTVSGFQADTLLTMLGPDRDGLPPPRTGLVIGIVTDNNDDQNLGRVKVKFPWLSDKHGSDWARVVVPGGGQDRGMQFLPEVNDEVLVGFEHGDINFPFVLGGLWNGKAAPPGKTADVIASGKVNKRIIKSRTGHIITLDDSEDAPSIEIVDNTKKNKITLDSKSNKLTVHLEGDMLFEATQGDIKLSAKTVTVEASDALKMKGRTVDADADNDINVKSSAGGVKLKGMTADMEGTTSVSVKGLKAEVKGDTQLSLDGGVMTEVKGAMVKVG